VREYAFINKSGHADNLISVDDLRADVYFRMHCTLTDNLATELHLLWDRYSVNRNDDGHKLE